MSGFVIGNDDFNIRQNVSPDQGVTQFYVDQHDAATLQSAKEYVNGQGFIKDDDLGELAYKDSASGSVTPTGSVTISEGSGTANYTPEGSVSTPTITVTPATDTVDTMTATGSLPSFTATITDENLTFTWDAGALPTQGSKTVVTGITSATASQPTFTGSGVELEATFIGTQIEIEVS